MGLYSLYYYLALGKSPFNDNIHRKNKKRKYVCQ